MTSKETLEKLVDILTYEQLDLCDENNYLRIIKKDLERLEKYKKAIKVLNGFVLLTKGRNLKTNEWNIPFIYSLAKSKLITQQEYELLKGVLGNDK